MALASLDDKILGEKVDCYCSSSEDDENSNFDSEDESAEPKKLSSSVRGATFTPQRDLDGKTAHTGPKGVIEDWRRYKQLETEKRERDAVEKQKLCEKLSMTCKSFKEDQNDKTQRGEDDAELSEDDDFMEWYKQKRIFEMQQKYAAKWSSVVFGEVVELKRENFIEAIENEKKLVTVIIHIYDENIPACQAVNGCMRVLASKYKSVKFCRIKASEASVSNNFLENALPSIIVYKNNTIIGNFVRISDSLGEDFFAPELEHFLLECGLLPLEHELPQT